MIRVHVRGLDGFQHDLTVSRDRLIEGVRDLMSELSSETADDARGRARRGMKTGASMNSIRAMGPVVRAGDDVPWYGFADFGGRVGVKRSIVRTYIKGGRWLFPAVRDLGVVNRSEAMVEKAIKELR
jgi:hypothetical protein